MKRIFLTLALWLAATTPICAATPGEISEGSALHGVTMRGLMGEPAAFSLVSPKWR